MTPQTLEALKKSIEHWEENAKIEEPANLRLGVTECALCNLFFYKECTNCPVYEHTKRKLCKNTPYYDVKHHKDMYKLFVVEENKEACKREIENCKQAVQAELDFLKSLLPKE